MKPFAIIVTIFMAAGIFGQEAEAPYGWITGTWIGDGFGGTSEEIWSSPSPDGTLMGSYRHFNADGSINFYEFFLLDSSGLRLKHFSPEFEGWESKEEFFHFKMVEISQNQIKLEGLIYELVSDDTMKIYLDMKTKEGSRTEVFTMNRK